MTAPLPAAIGRYAIEAELGRGTMGVVYRARDSVLQRPIALKTFGTFAALAEDVEAFEQRFLNEARIAAQLSHPGIVTVHDFGRDADTGTLYIALEYLEGETLDVIARRGPMEWARACRVVAAVARALHAAHAFGFVHRDVKPANIMLLPNGEPKLMDFGIARLPTSDLTRAGEVFGTPSNMSPEQASGEGVDARSDLFSLGTVLYHLLTGQRAFTGENLPKILHAVLTTAPTPPSQLAPMPASVDAIVARALAKSPAARYRSGVEMAEDLEEAAAGRAPRHAVGIDATFAIPRAVPTAAPAPIASRPRRWAAIAAVAGLVAAIIVIALAFRGGSGKTVAPVGRAERSAPLPAVPDTPQGGRARLTVDFEHHLRAGALKVWVDDDLVLDREVTGRQTQRLGRLRIYKGQFHETVDVDGGTRALRVEVAWDGKVRTARTTATFKPDAERTLDVEVVRVLDELELRWK